jgi:hypothetical protein
MASNPAIPGKERVQQDQHEHYDIHSQDYYDHNVERSDPEDAQVQYGFRKTGAWLFRQFASSSDAPAGEAGAECAKEKFIRARILEVARIPILVDHTDV